MKRTRASLTSGVVEYSWWRLTVKPRVDNFQITVRVPLQVNEHSYFPCHYEYAAVSNVDFCRDLLYLCECNGFTFNNEFLRQCSN